MRPSVQSSADGRPRGASLQQEQGWTQPEKERHGMLRWALAFFVVAIVAALLGFTGIAVATAGVAKILFFIFLVLFLISLIGHLLRET